MKLSGNSDKLDGTKRLLKYQLHSNKFLIKEFEAEKILIASLFKEGSFGNNALLIGAPKSGKTTVKFYFSILFQDYRNFCIFS